MKIKYIIGLLVAVLIVGIAYILISPLFITVHMDEVAPVSSSEEATTVNQSDVIGSPGHPASGTARLIKTDEKNLSV